MNPWDSTRQGTGWEPLEASQSVDAAACVKSFQASLARDGEAAMAHDGEVATAWNREATMVWDGEAATA